MAFGGGARGSYLRAARAAAAVRASRPARATCSKRVRAVPARPLGSGACATLPGGGCSAAAARGAYLNEPQPQTTSHVRTQISTDLKCASKNGSGLRGVQGGVGKLGKTDNL